MTNREWLNTLSDEEFIEWDKKDCREKFGRTTTYCNSRNVTVSEHCTLCGTMWLQALRHTTADEDFAEIGFINKHELATTIQYTDNEGRLFFMAKCGTNSYSNIDGENADWTDDLIDQIRTIADKKRKEVWG